jgi:hypothetical protein
LRGHAAEALRALLRASERHVGDRTPDAMGLAYFKLNPLWAAIDEHPVDILGFIVIVSG